MLEPLLEGRADHVIGDRFANIADGAMPRLNRFGNGIINRSFRFVHGRDLGDILSGYRAFTTESVERFGLTATGFAIETELSVECVKHNVSTEVVPITYAPRPEDSETNLHPLKDGGRIVLTLYKLAKTNNPLFYFGSIGIVSLLLGGGLGLYVVVEWVTKSVSHEVMALGSAAGIILGVQLLIFGVLSDMIVALHREQLRQLRQLERRVDPPAERSPPGGRTGSAEEEDARNRDQATTATEDEPSAE
jgi:dolichol-phosphate mannosyltransferase